MKHLVFWTIVIITAIPEWVTTNVIDKYGKVQVVSELNYRSVKTYERHESTFLTRDSAMSFYLAAKDQKYQDSCTGGTACTYMNNRQFVDSIKIDSIP